MTTPFTVYIRKPGGKIIDQYLSTIDQVKRWKKLAIANGYEIVKDKPTGEKS